MVMELSRMEPVSVRTVWPHEERDFTPWLAEHFDYLNDALDMNMVVVAQEAIIPGAGRADILARSGDFNAIIENQLEGSDDDHFVRMLHYAARNEAQVVIWIAHGFQASHREILRWLNEHSDLDIYCVEVSAWSIGGSVAPMFRRVVPHDWVDPTTLKERIEIQQYRSFYRPLRAALTEAGMVQIEPSWDTATGYQWFESGFDDIYFGLAHDEGKLWAFLWIDTGDEDRTVYRALLDQRSKMEGELDTTLEDGMEDSTGAWIGFTVEAPSVDNQESRETAQTWMRDNLLNLWTVMTPYLAAAVRDQDG